MKKERVWRQLHIPPNKPRLLNSQFSALAGIALAVLFMACVCMAYYAHLVK
jgi:hypothetical protein